MSARPESVDEAGRAAEEHASRRALFARLIESLPSAAMVETAGGGVLAVNQSFCELFAPGESPQSLVGRQRRQILAGAQRLFSDPEGFQERIDEILQDGSVVTQEIIRLADHRMLSRDYVPIAGEGGEVAGHLWLFKDVTGERPAPNLMRLPPRLEAVGRLAGGVAHDLNNALTTILGHVSLLGHEVGDQSHLAESVSEIHKAAERAATLTRGLLAFGRRQALQPRAIDPSVVLERVEAALRRTLGKDIELRVEVDPAPATVRVDAAKLEHALLNLGMNARDAMPRGGTLSLALRQVEVSPPDAARYPFPFLAGRYAVFSVADTGSGIPEEIRPKVFEPFFTTKSEGSGLGLSAVYGFVKQSGGYIWVEGHNGSGSVFLVALPLEIGGPPAEAVASAEPERIEARPVATVLIAEDEPSVLAMVERALSQRGYRVLAARDGVEALDVLRRHAAPVDLLVTDANMPRMGGMELVNRVRELLGDVPVLITSGYSGDVVRSLAEFGGDTRLLEKPFLAGDVAEAVDEMLA